MAIISISGSAGSGKSTVGRMLAQRLGLPFVSIGDLRRRYALEHGMTLEQLNERGETDPTSDLIIDEYQQHLPEQHSAFIIDARLGFHFLPQSIKLFVSVSKEIGATRIFAMHRESENWESVEQGIKALEKREHSDKKRYHQYYDIDPYDTAHYDLVVDSGIKTPEEVVEELLTFLKSKGVAANSS